MSTTLGCLYRLDNPELSAGAIFTAPAVQR
jgi:hypothetical protein